MGYIATNKRAGIDKTSLFSQAVKTLPPEKIIWKSDTLIQA
jgi:hypothetical protein